MIGQYSNEEFMQMYQECKNVKEWDVSTGTAWMKYGTQTYNYYRQHSDSSWTNFDCRTRFYTTI